MISISNNMLAVAGFLAENGTHMDFSAEAIEALTSISNNLLAVAGLVAKNGAYTQESIMLNLEQLLESE